jgi:hypothetical protein
MIRSFNPGSLGRLAATAVLAAGILLAGCSEMVSRTDFAARVKDKSDAEVAKVIGKPSAVDESKPDRVTWTYTSKTFNVDDRNKFDTKAVVVFSKAAANGKLMVTDVQFE